MDNRIIFNQTFTSHYFDPTRNTRKNKKNESHFDFYIFFSNDVSINNVCSFYSPSSYVHDYSHTSFQSEEEAFIIEILLHQKVVDVINDPESKIEELYLALLEYFCYGEDFFLTISSYPKGNVGIIALFDESFTKPTVTSIIEPDVNMDRFYLKE